MKVGKHNDLVNLVEDELINRGYTNIRKFIEYRCGSCGEMDVFALKDDYVLLFEIKCNKTTKSYSKAKKQLNRAERYYFRDLNKRVFKFLVYKYNDEAVYEWIKNSKL